MIAKTLVRAIALLIVTLLASATSALTLQNDGFSGGSVFFQSGFMTGEIGAVTLGPVADPFTVESVQLLFGGASTTETVTLKIFEETGVATPGSEMFSSDYSLTGSDYAWQVIDLSAQDILLQPGSYRFGIQYHHSGYPGIARDDDGNIQTGRNWVNLTSGGWVAAETLGLTGDFIIRADVNIIPEPTTAVLLAVGLVGLAAGGRRRRA
jgi:hypothetical protein